MNNNIREIKEKHCVFSKCVDVDIDYQESLMSYHDDMLKVIRCQVTNDVVNTDYSSGSLTVYGKTKIFITYVSETTSCLTTADFEEEFKKIIQIDCDCDDVVCDVTVLNKYNNFRIINQRRIDVHSCFALKINATCIKQIEMIVEDDNLLIKKDLINYLSYIGRSVNKSEFEEEAVIPSDSEVIKKVINSFYTINIEETKIIKDKMLAKISVAFSVLYTTDTENEAVRKCEKSISTSKIIDINGIDEGDIPIINADLGNLYLKPKADVNNELRVIDIVGDLSISSSVFRSIEAEISTDSYSTVLKTENQYNQLMLNSNGKYFNDVISDSALFEFDNINIKEVMDLTVSVTAGNELELTAFVVNENGQLICLNQKKEINISDFRLIKCYVKNFDYVIKSTNTINLRFSIEYFAVDYEEKAYNILSSIKTGAEYDTDSPALVVYFANQNETLWEIAKKFRTSAELIKRENELNTDTLDTSRVLLIPGI